jgi:glutaredoxin
MMIKHELDFSEGTYVIGHFTYPKCPSCEQTKELLREHDIQYMFIQADKKLFGKVMKVSKSTTVPQIFMNGEYIGGYDELVEKLNNE